MRSHLFVAALDLALWWRLPADVRRRLAGRKVEIVVTDRKLSLRFTARRFGFVPRLRFDQSDLRIAAAARDFGALAAGDTDADTLYFSRRLVVEGDTELALLVKNTLDAMEPGPGRRLLRAGHRLACRIRGLDAGPLM